MLNRRQKDFLGAVRGVLSTQDGKKLFKYLIEDHVQASALQPSVELTYYKLGQKELIQALLQDANMTEEDFAPIQTFNTYEE